MLVGNAQRRRKWQKRQWCTPDLTQEERTSTTPSLKRPGGLGPTSMKVLLCVYSKAPSARQGPSSPLSPLPKSQPTDVFPSTPSTLLGTHFTCVPSCA